MKHIILSLFALHSSIFTLSAAVPVPWTVDMRRAQPATFEEYQGETLDFKAALMLDGKPFEAPSNYSFFWQTNGMGRYYWSRPVSSAPSPTNVLFATWLPEYDCGARVYNCFIGSPSNNYHSAFQLRLRPSPGATPNELPLPQKVIDFAKVTVLNPPWSSGGGGGGVDTNAVVDIVHKTVDGSARYTPKYLWVYDCADSYPEAAHEYYSSRGNGKTDGGCSSVRDGGFLYRNFDYPFDDRSEFVVHMSSGPERFASVGVAQVGTNLTEQIVTSGKPSRWYKALPGATVDGINENGVACNINVVDGDPQTSGWHTTGDLHPLGAIRWILDHATNAQHGAEYIAANIRFPQGFEQNFHYMVADATSTYIVENGEAYPVPSASSPTGALPALTNFRLYPTRDTSGEGQERYDLLLGGANITNAWYTRAYLRSTTPYWYSEFHSDDFWHVAVTEWAKKPKEEHRGESFDGESWWQSVHTSIYDITNRTLRIAVQETDDWYTFAVDQAKIDAYTKAETDAAIAAHHDSTKLDARTIHWDSNGDLVIGGDSVYPNLRMYTGSIEEVGSISLERPDGVSYLSPIDGRLVWVDLSKIAAKRDMTNMAVVQTAGNFGILGFQGDGYDTDLWRWDESSQTWNYGEDKDLYYIFGEYVNGVHIFTCHYSDKGNFVWTGYAKTRVGTIYGRDLFFEPIFSDNLAKVSQIPPKYVPSPTDPTFSNAVDQIVRSLIPTTLRAYDPVRQCWWNIQPVNGVLTLTVED